MKVPRQGENWICPHCDRAQTVVADKRKVISEHIYIDDLAEGPVGLIAAAVGCSNPDCRKLTMTVSVRSQSLTRSPAGTPSWGTNWAESPIANHNLLPESAARPQPDYIPAPLRDDYYEACRIRDLSPKAAATLARRCLQGMIRDFAQVSKATLYAEIQELHRLIDENKAPSGVTAESVEAIDQVRGVGNIGAHMEKDINLIVPVDAGEAQLLIELVEMLFQEWYVERRQRAARLARIAVMAAEKQQQRDEAKG